MSIARHHAEWLSLVPVSGPFLSLPVLMEAFNTGLEPHDPEHVRLLRQEYERVASDGWRVASKDPAAHYHFIRFVLNTLLDFGPSPGTQHSPLIEGQAIPQTLHVEVPEYHELLRPSIVVNDPGTNKARLLVQTYPRSQELTSYVANSPWKASPDTRMTELLHGTGVRLGLVTNGEHWMLVDAPKGETTGYASWYASLWLEEYITLRAFRSLLSASRFFNVPDDQTLEALLAKSASNQQEVTDQLGYQVRRAVEVLIHSLDRADQDFGRELLADVSPEQLYESALTVMMRLVFLFCAEERELIPSKPFPVYEQNYSVSTISKQLRELADQHGEELLERRYDAWPRLLAAFRAVYGGLKHDDVHIPAYGGNLFNPDRFPFLEGRKKGTTWRVTGGGWRGEYQGESNGGETLPGTGGVANGDGLGSGVLPSHENISQGRTIRDDEPDSTSGSFNPGKQRRGTRKGIDQGVSELPEHQQGIADGSGNAPPVVPAVRIAHTGTTRFIFGSNRPNQPDVVGTTQSVGKSPLNPPSTTHHPPRFQEANPLPVNNRTVLHLLEALQLLQIKVPGGGPAEARRLSFRALDIEQIGHVYEGLLDHTAKRAAEPYLGLAGTRDKEPEIALAALEVASGEWGVKSEEERVEYEPPKEFIKWLKEETGRSESALKKSLQNSPLSTPHSPFLPQLRTACGGDEVLLKRVMPFAGLIRLDSFGNPVVIPKGSVFVTAGTDRRSSGTHYTPRSLTEPIVQYTLEPLVYVGPAEGKPKGEWKLKSAKELLELKICDMACGSGAFLVQSARYMSERLLEAWASEEGRVESQEGRVKSGEKDGSTESSRLDRLAEGDGPRREVLQGDEIFSQGRVVRNDKSNTESGSVDSSQRSGRTGAATHEGVSELPEHRTGIIKGIGNSSGAKQPSGDIAQRPVERVTEFDRRNQQNVGSAETQPNSQNLTPSPLPTRPVLTTPHSSLSTGSASESILPTDPLERTIYALRLVTQRCLYGVDKNPLAAEMAKLSLWLLTLAKDKPFEFLDHSIRCGDSLVGLHSIDQLRHYSLKPDADDAVLFKGPLDSAVDEAITLRLKLEDMPANTVDDVQRQEKLLIEANEKIARLRCAADLLVAAEFWGEGAKDKLERVRHAAVKSGHYVEKGPTEEFEQVARKAWLPRHSPLPTPHSPLLPFHWPLEFPEVIVKRGGFDAFVGNPPFMGGQKITGSLGAAFRDYLVEHLAQGQRGSADLCVYFFLRAGALLRPNGQFGFVSTNTISQGNTREVGLDLLETSGFSIPRAVPSRQWPGLATVEVAHLWLRKGPWNGQFMLDDAPSGRITSYLTETGSVTGNPFRLQANAGKSFQGSTVLGMGFVLEPHEAERIIATDARYKDVLFPYLIGEDLNAEPDQSARRWVINFFEWPLNRAMAPSGYWGGVASDYPLCLEIVERKVKPERLANRYSRNAREKWWLYERSRPELYSAIADMKRVLVRAQVSKTHAPVLYPTGVVFSSMTIVLALNDESDFAIIQSGIHETWLNHHSSSLRTDQRYTPTDCFETFAFPATVSHMHDLAGLGSEYHEHRCQAMLKRKEGLTKTYNRFHNPDETSADIQKLRELHVEMDQAVAAAYGWTELDLGHDFHDTKQGVRFTLSEPARREVLQRLLKLNHERYAVEVKQGLHGKKRRGKSGEGRVGSEGGRGKKKATGEQKANLFDAEEGE